MKSNITSVLSILVFGLTISSMSHAVCSVTRYGPSYPQKIKGDNELEEMSSVQGDQYGAIDGGSCTYPKHVCADGTCGYACR